MNDNVKIVRAEQPEPEVREIKIVNNSLKEDKK